MNGNCTPARARGRLAGSLVLGAVLVSGCAAAAGPGPARAAVLPAVAAPVSCGSPAAWLKLTSLIVTISFPSAHEVSTCYTGSGTRTVAVPQVERAAVKSGHTACLDLYQNGRVLHICIAGGKSRGLELPTVVRVQLTDMRRR